MADLVSVLNSGASVLEQISSLETQAGYMLKTLKGDLATNVAVERGYIEKIEGFKKAATDLEGKISESETIKDIRSGSLTNRITKSKAEISKLNDVVIVCEKLIEIENNFKDAPTDIIPRAALYVKVMNMLAEFDHTKLENMKLIKGYALKLRKINPITEINMKWMELTTITENEINLQKPIKEVAEAARIVGKVGFFQDKIYDAFSEFISSEFALKRDCDSLKLDKGLRSDIAPSLEACFKSLSYWNELGFGPAERHSIKILNNLMDSFLHKAMPTNEASAQEIKKLIQIIIQMKPILNIDISAVHKFSENLGNLIKKSKIAKCLEAARKLLVDKSEQHFREVIHQKIESEVKQEVALYQNRPVTKKEKSLNFQNVDYPISARCQNIWELMNTNPDAARLLVTLYFTIMPTVHAIRFQASFPASCLYYSDIQFLIGGLSALTARGSFDQLEKLKIVAVVPRMQISAQSTLHSHLNQIKEQIDASLVPELPKITKMTNQFVYDEVSKVLQNSVFKVKVTLNEMKKYLPDPQVEPFAAILTNVIGDLLFETLVALEDITADLCTPIDNLINNCVELPAYNQTKLEDVRFMLRSSLLEITSNFKSGELQLQSAQVRSMIRALFSNSDHRQKALAKIQSRRESN